MLSDVQLQKKRGVVRRKVAIPKYESLNKVKEMFWSTWEEINKNELGKMSIRSVRNTMQNILTNNEFWSIMNKWISKQSKLTHNKIRADAKVKFCNTLTEALIDPVMSNQFRPLAESVYEAVVQINSDELEQGLQMAVDIVTGDEILEFMKMVESLILRIDLDPKVLTRYFNKFKSTLNYAKRANMSDGMNNRLMKVASTLGGSNKTLKNVNSARSNIERSSSARI